MVRDVAFQSSAIVDMKILTKRTLKRSLADDALILLVAAGGGGLFQWVGAPAGWLTGAMLAVALVGVRRRWLGPSEPLTNLGMLLSGAVIGSAATPDAVALLARNPSSLVLLLASLVATMVVTGVYLERVAGWRRLDAILASAPGALSAVMAIARETSSDIPAIAVVQLFRLFLLVAVAPGLLAYAGVGASGASLAAGPGAALDIVAMLGCGAAAGFLFHRLGVMAPMILGATFASAALHATDLVHGGLPYWLAAPGFVIVGALIGSRFGTITARQMLGLLPVAVIAFIASAGVAAGFAAMAAQAAGVSFGVAFIAFAPGGLEAMALLAVLLGLDPLFVGAHHMVRFMAVGLLLPLAARLGRPRDGE
jgi:membrane AbrB-like protein